MVIHERVPGDRARLTELVGKAKNVKQRNRYRCVALALDKRETLAIADAVGCSRRFVQRWVYVYRDGGIDAIKAKKQPGSKPRLTPEEQALLVARIQAGPKPEDGVCTLRGLDLVRIIQSEFGKVYSLNGVYELLHRLGFSSLRPRPRHRKNDPAAMEAFKASAPLLSSELGKKTRARRSKSGSRTKRGSANRAR